MIDMKQIHAMWKEDCAINNIQLDETSKQTPALHSKYLQYWSSAKVLLKRAVFEQIQLLKDKWLYYNGKMDQKTLEENWKRSTIMKRLGTLAFLGFLYATKVFQMTTKQINALFF